MAKREKKPVHHVQMTEGKRSIIQQLFQECNIESAQDIQDTLKDLLGGTSDSLRQQNLSYCSQFQRCIVHQVRNTLKYVAGKSRVNERWTYASALDLPPRFC